MKDFDVKLLYKQVSKNRYKIMKDYKFDRLIFNIGLYVILGFLFFVAYSHNFQLDYFNCVEPASSSMNPMLKDFDLTNNKPGHCKNPFYKSITWKNQEYLPPGEYGTRPTRLFNSIWLVSFFLFVLSFIVNHVIHNRKFDFKKFGGEINEENNNN